MDEGLQPNEDHGIWILTSSNTTCISAVAGSARTDMAPGFLGLRWARLLYCSVLSTMLEMIRKSQHDLATPVVTGVVLQAWGVGGGSSGGRTLNIAPTTSELLSGQT